MGLGIPIRHCGWLGTPWCTPLFPAFGAVRGGAHARPRPIKCRSVPPSRRGGESLILYVYSTALAGALGGAPV